MKCVNCNREFEPTEEEAKQIEGGICSYIPFCCQKSASEYWPNIRKSKRAADAHLRGLLWHKGPVKAKPEIGKGKVIPMKPGLKPKFRMGGFSYAAPGNSGLLPSEIYFGKANTRVLDEADISLGGEYGDSFNFEDE